MKGTFQNLGWKGLFYQLWEWGRDEGGECEKAYLNEPVIIMHITRGGSINHKGVATDQPISSIGERIFCPLAVQLGLSGGVEYLCPLLPWVLPMHITLVSLLFCVIVF
uniref:Uncharacterized protein n=1 Tax=Sphaerodactylus townsendi TaxID=933632 RepID=A0ACB8EKT0_9SAUR